MAAPVQHVRKSVENLVMSSHDAIGQSISNALSFSGVITQSSQQPSDRKSPSRSPSPGRRSISNATADSGDGSVQSGESGNSRGRRNAPDFLQSSSPQPTLTVSTPLPDHPPLIPLNRSASQECQPRHSASSQSVPSLSVLNLSTAGQNKSQEPRTKKKSWYNALYPTYKSRAEDFKRIFKDIPDDERLIVDYSCAIQKDILVHGRLYVSQKYLCFYANIFRWETLLCLQWKDVSAITKEKTALVIPNAILVSTDREKHFFTSFSGRDKAYMMLFTIWQNALMDKSITSQEMWHWVHSCYGEQLGFDSDDEEYPHCLVEDDKLSGIQLQADSVSDDLNHSIRSEDAIVPIDPNDHNADYSNVLAEDVPPGSPAPPHSHWFRTVSNSYNADTLPTDMSDTSDSERNKTISAENHVPQCTYPHDGRKLLGEEFPVHIDQLFTMLFTNSKFYVELLSSRKTTDLIQASWKHDPESGLKIRKVSFTLLLGQAVGPKTAAVTETQVMLACTKPGHVYSIEVTSCNAGIPYADSFTVVVHYCLQRVSDNVTGFQVFGQIKYKKSVWGFVKSIIEKNCWMGLEEYFDYLAKALHVEIGEEKGRRKSRRRRRATVLQGDSETGSVPASPLHRALQIRKSGSPLHERIALTSAVAPSTRLVWVVLAVLCVLLVINGALYWRLWGLEDGTHGGLLGDLVNSMPNKIINNGKTPSPDIIAEWSKVLKDQSSFHIEELDKWRKALNDAIALLKQTESALANLQTLVQPSVKKIKHTEL